MNKLARQLLRVALVVLLLGSVLAQVLVPVFASEAGRIFPEVAYLVVPYSVAAILFIGCGQVALLVVWRLLSMVNGGAIFTRRAVRWVDVITACGAVATVLSAGVMIHMLGFVPGGGGPRVYLLAGWQSSTRQIESRVVNRMARARPFFKTATFAGVMPTALAKSPTDILRRASMTSSSTMRAIRSSRRARYGRRSPTRAGLA